MALGPSALRQLGLRVLAHRQGSTAGDCAAAAKRAYEDFAQVSAPLIGDIGINALTGRTLYLLQQQYPWLAATREPEEWDGPFEQILFCLEGQDSAVATEAAGAMLATLAGLLVTFIGEPLTVSVLRKSWPDAFSDGTH